MKFGIVGDVHGRNYWKQIIPFVSQLDKIIFIGDYMDSFHITPQEQIKNLKEIVEFKKVNNDKIELLLGNHDLSYLDILMCKGFSYCVKEEAKEIFKSIEFKLAYEFKDVLFTHAGLTEPYLEVLKTLKVWKYAETFSEALNFLLEYDSHFLDFCSKERGGSDKYSSIVWCGENELKRFASKSFKYQVVGHTPIPQAYTENNLFFVDDQYPAYNGFHILEYVDGELNFSM